MFDVLARRGWVHVVPACYVITMTALPRNKPQLYIQVSLNGKPGARARVLWNATPGPAHGSERPLRWCVTEGSPEMVTVKFLANLLRVKPFRVVADLLDLGIVANAEQSVSLETAFEVLRQHGYKIEKE